MLVVALSNRERSPTAARNQIHLQARLGFIGQICLPGLYHRVSRGRWRSLPVLRGGRYRMLAHGTL